MPGAPEGTAVLSTGETGGTKFLREDGDGTSSWQNITGGGDALVANPLSQFAATTSAQLAGVLSDETGTGAAVFANSPTLVTPALGTPSSGVATNLTGTAAGLTAGNVTTNANLTGHVTSVGNAATLGSFTAAQLNAAISDETLSGSNTGDEPAASDTVSGTVELATIAEVDTGTDTTRAITPAGLAGSALQTKVDGIESAADVTDAANVTAAGALMDSEVTNLAQVKAFDSSDYATAAQGTKADSAQQPPAEGAFVDGDKTKLDGIAAGAEVNAVDSVNTQTGAVVLDADDISDAATTNKFTTASDISKLAGIEAGADVTDSTNVSAAGAAIVSSGAGVPSTTPSKVGDIYIDTTSDDAYIAVGTASASDWEKSNDGSGSGATNLSWTASTSTISSSTGTDATLTNADGTNAGLMSSSDKTKLDGIASGAEVNTVDSVNTQTGAVVLDADDISDAATTNKFTTAADISKLAGIEAGADVTDTANVTARSRALMDSEVDADIKTLSLPASTTISTFGASLVDDADAATARSTLGVDAAGTDNSTNVTLAGTGTYISIAGQVITVDPITESDISDLGTYLTAESDTLDSVTGRGATTTNGITVGSIDVNGEIIELAVNTTGVTGSTALDPANGTIQRLTFSGAVTFTDSLADGESITLHIDDGTAYTATWPTMEWVGGSAPTLDTTNETIVVVWKVNSTLYGMSSGVAS